MSIERPKSKPSAKQFYDSIKDKNTYYWKTSGIHTYNVLLKGEGNVKLNASIKTPEQKKFEEWLK